MMSHKFFGISCSITFITHIRHMYAARVSMMATPTDLDKYDTCLTCKMKKSARQKGDTRENATEVGQGISIDFGFMVQKSKNKGRMKTLTSLDGSTIYIVVTNITPMPCGLFAHPIKDHPWYG
eukprot:7350519-Ditylum_brightwellii.AAC.1